MKKYFVILFAMLYISSCHSSKSLISSDNIITQMQDTYPGYSLTEFNSGKKLYQNKCNTCHELKNPTDWNETQWKKIVPAMCLKAKENYQPIEAKAEELILKYLVSVTTTAQR